jgi:Na+/proline symporter
MRTLDLVIIFGYLIGIVLFGSWFARKQQTTTDYFLGDRSVPWWAVAFSIVATETSTITFISVPGIAFARGGNFQFLQLVFGYLAGRIVISFLFIPSYFRGELLTVYQLLDRRFGGRIKMVAASLFVVMRNIADGIRLLLTAIVLSAVYTSFQPSANAEVITVASIVLLGVAMIVFTYFGGMEAVIWVEVIQLGIYIAGAIAAAVIITNAIDGGFSTAMANASQFNKFSLFDFSFDFTKTFTFWAGLIGGCFLTMSTHGTDQYLVQRYLCTDHPRKAVTALLTSGAIVLGQFIGFSVHRRAAVFVLPSLHRSRICHGHIDCVSIRRRRPGLSGLHHQTHAQRPVRSRGRRHLRGCDVLFFEFNCRNRGQRSLQTFSLKQNGQALPEGLAHSDFVLGCRTDRSCLARASPKSISPRPGTLHRVSY